MEDYLEAVGELCNQKGAARVKDIASKLNVTTPSVVSAIKNLKRKQLVEQERYGFVRLTRQGEKTARSIIRRHQVLYHFLINVLGLDYETASKDACRIEHAVSKQTLERLLAAADYIEQESRQGLNWSYEFQKYYADREDSERT